MKTILFILGLLAVIAIVFACTRQYRKNEPVREQPRLLDEPRVIELAIAEAKRLGYSTDEMTIDCKVSTGVYSVTFLPKTFRLGGDLTVKIDRDSGEVVEILRGQ